MPRPRLTTSDRDAVSRSIKQTKLVEASRKMARIVKTVHPSKKALRRRRRYEPKLHKWLKFYMPETFPDPWGKVHLKCCNRLEACIRFGGSYAIAMQRGGGKSAIGKGAATYAPLLGLRKYIVAIGATDTLALEYIDFIKNQLDGSNERISADYPEAVTFFKALDWKAIKANNQLREDGKKTGIQWKSKGLAFPEVLDLDGNLYPFSGARIECRGITAAMKGMSKTIGGKIIRPDFVLPDDAQTEDDALSEISCKKIEDKIVGTVLALAGPRKRIACFMPCTIVKRDDVSDRFLDRERHPEFQGEKIPMFISWPDEQEGLWKEYAAIRRAADDDQTGKRNATAFYKKHRKVMDAGAEMSWNARVRDGETSAVETAENLLIELGPEKFFAEMQQDPKLHGVGIYTLTPKIIMSRAQDRPASIVPDWAQVVICATDVNRSYALSTVIIAFGANQVSAVLWYGLHKMNVTDDMTEIEHRRLIYEALAVHGKKIASLTCRPDYWVIDGGGSPEGCVIRFAYNAPQICGLQASCCFGRGWKNFPKTIPKRHKTRAGEMLYMVSERRDRRWIIFHADFWREVAQKGWLAEPGSPGSCSLPAGHHEELAQQICREQLSGKEEVGDRMVWVFNTAPGKHDLGDCMTMAYMAASTKGYGTGGAVPSSSRRKKYTQKDLRR